MWVFNSENYVHHTKAQSALPHFAPASSEYDMLDDQRILWVRHPVSGIWYPHLVPDDCVGFRQRLSSGQASENDQRVARGMGLLHYPTVTVADQRMWASELQMSRTELQDEGYTTFKGRLMPNGYSAAVNKYTDATRSFFHFDDQVVGRTAFHNAGFMRAIHNQLTILMQLLTGQNLKPSYSYLSIYPEGSELKRHTDRSQCLWNASLMLSRSNNAIWPIYVETKGQEHRLDAGVGQLVVYRGTDVPHWRYPLKEGTATVCFFHFVDHSFTGDLR